MDELDFSEIALAFTGEQGVDVVVNTMGSAVFGSSLRSLNRFGRMVLLGEITGDTEVISKVTVGGVESHRTQSGVGRVGTNSMAWGISCKVLTTFGTSSP